MSVLVVVLTVLGLCVLVGAGLAFERRFGQFLSDWGVGSLPATRDQFALADRIDDTLRRPRWTEAQLFEPVSKWVEDAERAAVERERQPESAPCRARGCGRAARVVGLCLGHAAKGARLVGSSAGGYVDGEYVVRVPQG